MHEFNHIRAAQFDFTEGTDIDHGNSLTHIKCFLLGIHVGIRTLPGPGIEEFHSEINMTMVHRRSSDGSQMMCSTRKQTE